MSWAEAKWIVDNLLQKIGQQPNNTQKFIITPLSETSVGLMFLEPRDSYDGGNLLCTVGGVMIRKSTTGYPQTPYDGELVIDNKELGKYNTSNLVVGNLQGGTKYYFSAFPYSTQGVFNMSSSSENRQIGIPNTGETVNVSITIDDSSAFTSVAIRCVDETESSKTQTKQLTANNKSTSFVVPVGHNYHVEYGEMTNYIKPSNSLTKQAVGGNSVSISGDYLYFKAFIEVIAPSGTNLTCDNGDVSYSGISNGTYRFTVHKAGNWEVTGNNSGDTASNTVVISNYNQTQTTSLNFISIYGISRNVNASSPIWTRTDDSVGKNATATVGTIPGVSDFDSCYPWSAITKSTQGDDVMVWIPEFWYKRYLSGDIEYIKIANKQTADYTKHPGSGVWVGAYKSTAKHKSEKNGTPFVNYSMSSARQYAATKGSKWGVLDLMTLSAIQMLYLVEFATYNSQSAIGEGRVDTPSVGKTGECDDVSGGTGRPAGVNGQTGIIYRGIENLWGTVYELIDGVYPVHEFNDSSFHFRYMISTNPLNYGKSESMYTTSRIKFPQSSPFRIKKLGLDTNHSWGMLPDGSNTSNGSTTTFMCDKFFNPSSRWGSAESSVLLVGGIPSDYSASRHRHDAGLFSYRRTLSSESSYTCRFVLRK